MSDTSTGSDNLTTVGSSPAQASGLHALDLRSGKPAWSLRTERRLGLMHCWASDAAAQWLVLGSGTGQCVLFDLRYQLRLSSWSCGARSRIHCMVPYRAPPVGGSGLPAPLPSSGEFSGSQAMIRVTGLCSRSTRATPSSVPPVP